MKIKILSWNVRWANDRVKRKVIKALIRLQRADLVCLQETKIQDMSKGDCSESWSGKILRLGCYGCKGGCWWGGSVLELVGMEVGLFSILCRFKNCEDGFLWTFTGVYEPTMKQYRELFWEELGAIRGLWSDPWCIGGDFNVVKFPSERSREGRLTGSMRRFSKVIEELALRYLPLHGGSFTWSGGLNGLSRSRLDSFLISED